MFSKSGGKPSSPCLSTTRKLRLVPCVSACSCRHRDAQSHPDPTPRVSCGGLLVTAVVLKSFAGLVSRAIGTLGGRERVPAHHNPLPIQLRRFRCQPRFGFMPGFRADTRALVSRGRVRLEAANGEIHDTLKQMQDILDRYDVSIADSHDLLEILDYRVILIIDDSNSMETSAHGRSLWNLLKTPTTRWMELQETTFVLIELLTCCSDSGVDLFFLNRGKLEGIKSISDARLLAAFEDRPQGGTPLTETLQKVTSQIRGNKPTLLMILTDGEPTGGVMPFFTEMQRVVSQENFAAAIKVQIMACTGDPNSIGWLNLLDRELTEVDVTDDYASERAEVLKAGHVNKFTRGDWLIKALLGPINRRFDVWDEDPRDDPYYLLTRTKKSERH